MYWKITVDNLNRLQSSEDILAAISFDVRMLINFDAEHVVGRSCAADQEVKSRCLGIDQAAPPRSFDARSSGGGFAVSQHLNSTSFVIYPALTVGNGLRSKAHI